MSVTVLAILFLLQDWPVAPLPSPLEAPAESWPLPSERDYANAMNEIMLAPPCDDVESRSTRRKLTRAVDKFVKKFESTFGRKPQSDPSGDISYWDSPHCDISEFDRHVKRAFSDMRRASKALKNEMNSKSQQKNP